MRIQNPLQLAKFHPHTCHLMVTRWLLCLLVSYALQADSKGTNGQRNIFPTRLNLFIHEYVLFYGISANILFVGTFTCYRGSWKFKAKDVAKDNV